MLNKQNLHVHSNYADGKNSLEELVVDAIDKGFDSIGFSEHSYMPFSSYPYQMNEDGVKKYKREIAQLKSKYKGKIDIFCGMEFEFYSDDDTSEFDYLIGSVHYLDFGGKLLGFDRGFDETINYVNDNFNGRA